MISGMYVGEIIRKTIVRASENGSIFVDDLPSNMRIYNMFPTSLGSEVYDKSRFLEIFKETFNYSLDDDQYDKIWQICDVITRRAAGLCAAGLSALLMRINKGFSRIAADGSMFRRHTTFVHYVEEYIRQILPGNLDFAIELIDDGSGKGAALAACVVKENLKNTRNENQLSSMGLANIQ
ncbi:Hexokinase [Thelohanellus kitauei]|uniref:Phosphotransferase n=1 Tax=Thelohanellus kitauei TaxID=669202 RepID=A0A0C2J6G2_THEKT|nr:Hexokinase [Thelohanellus kitauei]